MREDEFVEFQDVFKINKTYILENLEGCDEKQD